MRIWVQVVYLGAGPRKHTQGRNYVRLGREKANQGVVMSRWPLWATGTQSHHDFGRLFRIYLSVVLPKWSRGWDIYLPTPIVIGWGVNLANVSTPHSLVQSHTGAAHSGQALQGDPSGGEWQIPTAGSHQCAWEDECHRDTRGTPAVSCYNEHLQIVEQEF